MKNGSKGGVAPRSLGLLFTFWDPPNISGMAEDTNLKFCMSTKVMDTKPKSKKIRQNGTWPRSRDLLFKFWDLPDISETAKGTKLKFSRQIDRKGH